MTNPATLFSEILALAESQKLNRVRYEAGGHGSVTAGEELRRVANEIRLKCEHFRALTSPSLDQKDFNKVDAEHLRRWGIRKGVSG